MTLKQKNNLIAEIIALLEKLIVADEENPKPQVCNAQSHPLEMLTVIDSLLGTVKNLDELTFELEQQGFTVKRGKYISVKAPEQKRFVRLKTLGDYYSEDILCKRIQIALDEKTDSQQRKVNDFNKIFYERIYQVSELVKKNEKLPRKYFKNQPYILQNDFDRGHKRRYARHREPCGQMG